MSEENQEGLQALKAPLRKEEKRKRVHIDGEDLSYTDYVGCLMIYSGGTPPKIKETLFSNCSWEFQGSAGNMLTVLARMAKSGEDGMKFVMEILAMAAVRAKDEVKDADR